MPDPINWSLSLPYYLVAIAFGYVIGSIPFGLIFTRLAGLGDVRNIGSGNIGATNVLRTGNKGLAAATLAFDMLKGTFAYLITYQFYGPDLALLAGLGAFIGHCFPIWLKFLGGKGVATYFGILAPVFLMVALIAGVIWLAVAFLFRYSSLASLATGLATPILLYLFDAAQAAQIFLILSIIMFIKHRANIGRLLRGEESRIGDKNK